MREKQIDVRGAYVLLSVLSCTVQCQMFLKMFMHLIFLHLTTILVIKICEFLIKILHNSFRTVRINLPLFCTVLLSNSSLFLSCRPFFVITFSKGLVGVEVTSVSFNTHKTCWKCCYNNESPTRQKQPSVRWKDGGK